MAFHGPHIRSFNNSPIHGKCTLIPYFDAMLLSKLLLESESWGYVQKSPPLLHDANYVTSFLPISWQNWSGWELLFITSVKAQFEQLSQNSCIGHSQIDNRHHQQKLNCMLWPTHTQGPHMWYRNNEATQGWVRGMRVDEKLVFLDQHIFLLSYSLPTGIFIFLSVSFRIYWEISHVFLILCKLYEICSPYQHSDVAGFWITSLYAYPTHLQGCLPWWTSRCLTRQLEDFLATPSLGAPNSALHQ